MLYLCYNYIFLSLPVPHHHHHHFALLFATGEEATGESFRTSLTTQLQRITEVVLALVPSACHLISTLTGRDPLSTKDTSGRILWRER